MTHHDAAHKLVDAEKALARALRVCTQLKVEDELKVVRDIIWQVGNGLYPDVIEEVRQQKADIT